MTCKDCETDTLVWFRELLHKAIAWGFMALVLIAGWFAAGEGTVLSLDECNPKLRDKTIGYLVISWAIWFAWIGCTARLWTQCPRHATVPTKAMLVTILVGCTIAKLAMELFAVKD